MKNLLQKVSFLRIALVVLAVVIVAVRVSAQFDMPVERSDAQYNAHRFNGIPTTLPTTSVSNSFTVTPMTLQQGQPLAVWWGTQGSNGSASNVILTFRLSYGATNASNYASTPVLTITNTLNGTNQIKSLTYFTVAQLLGARSIVPYQISNTNTNVANVGDLVAAQFRNGTGTP